MPNRGLSVGVMIIGSLFWEESSARRKWRERRLDLKEQALVRVPIRYGRKSATRGDAYTMVLSMELATKEEQLGTGIVVACKHRVTEPEGLVVEAEHLWAAEQNSEKPSGRISGEWGCIGLLLSPASEEADSFRNGWAERVRREPRYGNLSRGLGEGELVSADGEIAIPWPVRRDGRAIELDILLVTATNPSIAGGQYPSPGAIAGAWKTSGGRSHVSYFWNNRKHGIETFQDGEIEALLVSQEP